MIECFKPLHIIFQIAHSDEEDPNFLKKEEKRQNFFASASKIVEVFSQGRGKILKNLEANMGLEERGRKGYYLCSSVHKCVSPLCLDTGHCSITQVGS